jgi:hypothetical protein
MALCLRISASKNLSPRGTDWPFNKSGTARAVRSEVRRTWRVVTHFHPDACASRLAKTFPHVAPIGFAIKAERRVLRLLGIAVSGPEDRPVAPNAAGESREFTGASPPNWEILIRLQVTNRWSYLQWNLLASPSSVPELYQGFFAWHPRCSLLWSTRPGRCLAPSRVLVPASGRLLRGTSCLAIWTISATIAESGSRMVQWQSCRFPCRWPRLERGVGTRSTLCS